MQQVTCYSLEMKESDRESKERGWINNSWVPGSGPKSRPLQLKHGFKWPKADFDFDNSLSTVCMCLPRVCRGIAGNSEWLSAVSKRKHLTWKEQFWAAQLEIAYFTLKCVNFSCHRHKVAYLLRVRVKSLKSAKYKGPIWAGRVKAKARKSVKCNIVAKVSTRWKNRGKNGNTLTTVEIGVF